MATPQQIVKNQYENKALLVEQLMPLLDRGADETEAQFKERLMHVSNKKLLRLMQRAQLVQQKYGGREALVDKLVPLLTGGRQDADLRNALLAQSTGRLLDRITAASKRA